MMKMKTYQSSCAYLALLVFATLFLSGYTELHGDISLEDDGLVKIYYNGTWGTVCVSGDYAVTAQVICRSMGSEYASYYRSYSYLPNYLTNVRCRGDERSLLSCSGYFSKYSYCSSYYKLYVECQNNSTENYCSFENNMCGMVSEDTEYKWERIQPLKSAELAGPKIDHTTKSNRGKYVIARAVGVPGRKKNFRTQPFSGPIASVNFYYHMFGNDMGSLNVYIQTNNASKKSIGSISGNQGDKWKHKCLTVDAGYGQHQIIFEAVQGNGFQSDIALDDVTISENNCSYHRNASCNFNKDTCNYEIENMYSINTGWRITTVYGLTDRSGSGRYLTYNHNSFYYPHMKNSVMSPLIDIPNEKSKVEFYYYMPMTGPKELQVRFVEEGHKSLFTKTPYFWQDFGDHGPEWQYGCMDIPSKIGRIIFTAISGPGRYTTMALDDIVLGKGYCKTGITNHVCTFDNPLLCKYVITCMNTNEYTWRRHKGATPSYYTGPNTDASKKTNGHYIYAESSYGYINDTARLMFPVSDAKGKYLKFSYNMYGNDIGALYVEFNTNKQIQTNSILSSSRKIVWSMKGNKGKYWHKTCLYIEDDISEITFVAERGSSYQGDIAIDGVSVEKKSCPGPFDCDFQNGMCAYKVYQASLSWRIYTETSYSDSNSYLYIYSRTYTEDSKFQMKSPQAFVSQNSSVTFKYKMTGKMKEIALFTYDYYSQNKSWSSNDNNINEFITACVDFPFSTKTELMFQVTANVNSRSNAYAYLDDISVQNETCKLGLTYHFCEFKEVHLCDFHVECPENTNYNWSRESFNRNNKIPIPPKFSSKDYFMYTDSLYGRPGDKTRLSFSNVVPPEDYSLIFSFYLQQGSGKLQLNIANSKGKELRFEEFSVVPNPGWQTACVPVHNENTDVEFIATNGLGIGNYIALMDVGFKQIDCQARSISCHFSKKMICQYYSTGYDKWERISSKNYTTKGFYMKASINYYNVKRLISPSDNITNSCVQIRYKIIDKNCNFTIYNAFNNKIILSTVSDGTTPWRIAQMYAQEEATKLVFLASKTVYSGSCSVLLDYVDITGNKCPQLKCSAGTRKCKNNYCYSESKVCDRVNDCSDSSDEMNCSTSIACDFKSKYYCGYKIVNGWQHTLDNDTSTFGVNGSMQITETKGKMLSPYGTLTNSCVKFKYITNLLSGNFSVFLNQWNTTDKISHRQVWNELFFKSRDEFYEGQFQFPAGHGFLEFRANIWSGSLAIYNVTVFNGTCPEINCPMDSYKCLDNSKCVNKKNLCNYYWNCLDGSDETNCSNYITCDFEDTNMCGFRSDPESSWTLGTGREGEIPTLDYTENTYEGRYAMSRSGNESTLLFPEITIEDTSCLNFYYVLTGHGSLSIYDTNTFLMSFSRLNVDMWRNVNITLSKGTHNIHVEYSGRNTSYGVAAFDSVSLIPGKCSNKDCEEDWYPCGIYSTCYPFTVKCDGVYNCPNGEDEYNCTYVKKQPFRLVFGRSLMSGLVEKQYSSQYLPICSGTTYTRNVQQICSNLGVNGTVTQQILPTNVTGYYLSCKYWPYCYRYRCSRSCYCSALYVTCSDTICEHGEVKCPPGRNQTNSTDVCIRKESLCNGEIDCEDGTDEENCADCASGHWQCRNKKCVKKSLRCDGKKDCDDGSDEFRCFTYINKSIQTYYNGSYKNICVNNLNSSEIANQLCSYVGRSNGTFKKAVEGDGVQFTPSTTDSDRELIPGFKANSFENCKYMVLECSEQTCGTQKLDLFEPNIMNGHNALPGEWPWAAQIYHYNRFICTGSLLSTHYVLTAAHCVKNKANQFSVGVGSIMKYNGTIYNVSQVLIHSKYFSYRTGYDLALLHVEEEIMMSNYVQPICLPEDTPRNDRDYTVVGWGWNEKKMSQQILQEVKSYLLDFNDCKSYFSFIVKGIICSNNREYDQIICYGDSGGPLLALNNKGLYTIYGVSSFGQNGCDGIISSPGAFSSVSIAVKWIKSYI